ncbi:MAG: hypothetical protein AAF821_20065 [Cyanobacteria bacterium P01_D01_bin.156]
MASKQTSRGSSHAPNHHNDLDFWQQLEHDFPFHGIDEEELRRYTTQWTTCANELLGPVPSRSKKQAQR